MAKRQQDNPSNRTQERRSEPQNRPRPGVGPSKERRSEADTGSDQETGSQRGAGRSWVHDEPPLEQGDDPQHSGYSDRETPESKNSGEQSGRQSERPSKR